MTEAARRERLRREKILLTIFLVRQATSIFVLGFIAVSALQLPDRRLGYAMVPIAIAFCVWVGVLTARFAKAYRVRRMRLLGEREAA